MIVSFILCIFAGYAFKGIDNLYRLIHVPQDSLI